MKRCLLKFRGPDRVVRISDDVLVRPVGAIRNLQARVLILLNVDLSTLNITKTKHITTNSEFSPFL